MFAIRNSVKIINPLGKRSRRKQIKSVLAKIELNLTTSFLFFRAEEEAANVKALAIEVDIGTMPFNTDHEQRFRRAKRGGNNENEHHTSNGTSSLSKKLSSSKQPSPSSMNDLPPDSSKASLASMNSRKSTDLVDQTSSASLAVELQLQHNSPTIELARQALRELLPLACHLSCF